MTTKAVGNPPPAYRVFISSTYDDMKDYRNAAAEAMTNIQAIPMGMERFTATTQPVIDRCYEEIRQCQFCVSIIGFRYGSIYKDTNLSYSELEFNEAERLGIPILVFIRKGSIDSDRIDVEDFTRLDRFKKRLQSSASNRLTASFTTPEDLRDKLSRALQNEFSRKSHNDERKSATKSADKSPEEEYIKGASIYKKYILIPGEYCDQVVKLRVRFDGTFGSWQIKEELFEAYNLPIGKALYLNDLFVIGADYSNIGDEAKHIDAFAVGEAAKWILENNITKGSVFEGYFKLEWKYVKNIAGKSRIQIGASNAYIAKLILRNPDLKVVAQSANTAVPELSEITTQSQESIIDMLRKLM